MAISTSLINLPIPSPRNQPLSFSSPNNHRLVSVLLPSALPQRAQHTLSYRRRCSLSAAIPHSYLREDDLKKELISVIGEELVSVHKGGTVESLQEALTLVDLIQRLGIHRFFKSQIATVLKTVYIHWDERYGLIDANATVLGFRLLRLQGYHVHADVLKSLKREADGSFSAFSLTMSDNITGLLNFYKCSQVGFPQESKIMTEAKDFSRIQLTKVLSNTDSLHLLDSNQREEVMLSLLQKFTAQNSQLIKFSLTYTRECLLSRMEARSIVRHSWPSNGLRQKCLELACLDLEMLQKLYQQEMNEFHRWLDKQGLDEFSIERLRPCLVKYYVSAAMAIVEPQFSLYRLLFSKICFLCAHLDDFFDPPMADKQGVSCLQEAFHRWDASPVENLPLHKAIFESMYHTINEIGIAASKAQGRDLLPYIRELWQVVVDGYYGEAQWQFSCHSPSLEEYLPVATRTIFSFAAISSHIFILGEAVTDEAQQFFGKDSHLLYLVGVVTRLANDFGTAERELENERNSCNAIACYMKDHAGCTKEEAVSALKEMREASFREMEYEIFRCRGIVPDICIQAAMHFVQATGITYRMADALKTMMDTEYEELIKDYMGY